MSHHDHPGPDPQPSRGPFWRSRVGMVLIAFLAIAGLLLAYEHRVHLFSGNGLLAGLLVVCIVMHLFMHGGHGGHGGDDGANRGPDQKGNP